MWWGQGRVRTFSYFSSCVRMTEKAALPKKRDRKGKRITWGSGTTFTCYLFLLLGRENGEREGTCSMKFCPEPLARRTSTHSLSGGGGRGPNGAPKRSWTIN